MAGAPKQLSYAAKEVYIRNWITYLDLMINGPCSEESYRMFNLGGAVEKNDQFDTLCDVFASCNEAILL